MISPRLLLSIPPKERQKIMKRSLGKNDEISSSVKEIINTVKSDGDHAVIQWEKKFHPGLADYQIRVTKEEIAAAYTLVPQTVINALKQMKDHISVVHAAHLEKKEQAPISPTDGIQVWRVWRPISSVGLYVPGGKAVYPSSVLMTAIPAGIAGCERIVICSPPKTDGSLHPEILIAADLAGVSEIYKVGGAQAIAAMAYGTESIAPVSKIFGAGNAYVTMAKMLVYPEVAIDMPAGPSEVFIIADETADPRYIAADLLTDGEHGNDSACVLVTTSAQIAEKTANEITDQLRTLPTRDRIASSLQSYGLLAIAPSLEACIDFANEYAPEHLQIMTKDPVQVLKNIKHAGSVFIGPYTTKSSGDYATGANHVLPTGGMAHMYPPLGVDAFGKWMQVQECSKEGLSSIKQTLETIAQAEHLPAHIRSTTIRFERKTV